MTRAMSPTPAGSGAARRHRSGVRVLTPGWLPRMEFTGPVQTGRRGRRRLCRLSARRARVRRWVGRAVVDVAFENAACFPVSRRSSAGSGPKGLAGRSAELRTGPAQCHEVRGTVVALRAAHPPSRRGDQGARRRLDRRVRALGPALLETDIGPVTAAEMVCAWSHPGRVHSEAPFASLAGAAPIPASPGRTVRHRLDRCGDRRLNRALHSAVLIRCVRHAETRRYVERRRDPEAVREAFRPHGVETSDGRF